MNPNQLPLLEIFNHLRQRYGYPLGVDEYLAVLESLQAGYGVNTREELVQLCCLVWAKSEEEYHLIQRIFEEVWKPIETTPQESPPSLPSKDKEKEIPSLSEESEETNIPPQEIPESSSLTLEFNEPVQVAKAVRRSRQRQEIQRPRHVLLTDYFPVTRRQMKQSWRYLRRPVREGVPVELDVEATVNKIEREGVLLYPVLQPRRVNRTDLVLLIDRDGSMVPFHALSQQLMETAQRGGRLEQARVYYFHDCPHKYLYSHPALLQAETVDKVLEAIGKRTVVLIISDAGAARGNYDEARVQQTREFIQRLRESVRYLAWLNPMPRDSWDYTTASEIAQFVSMFEMSREGLNAAIGVLQGRYVIPL